MRTPPVHIVNPEKRPWVTKSLPLVVRRGGDRRCYGDLAWDRPECRMRPVGWCDRLAPMKCSRLTCSGSVSVPGSRSPAHKTGGEFSRDQENEPFKQPF